jgi:hypothetical protein
MANWPFITEPVVAPVTVQTYKVTATAIRSPAGVRVEFVAAAGTTLYEGILETNDVLAPVELETYAANIPNNITGTEAVPMTGPTSVKVSGTVEDVLPVVTKPGTVGLTTALPVETLLRVNETALLNTDDITPNPAAAGKFIEPVTAVAPT